jgi:hypothetical protein
LKLVARGRVARLEQGRAAIEIQQYEFRTQGSKGFTVQLDPGPSASDSSQRR